MLFVDKESALLADTLTTVKLRIAAGAIPAVSIGLRKTDRAKVFNRVVPKAVFCLSTGEKKRLAFTPLPIHREKGELRGLAISPKHLRWFGKTAGGSSPSSLLVYQRGLKESAYEFLARVTDLHIRQPGPAEFRARLDTALPHHSILLRHGENDNWQFLGSLITTVNQRLPTVWGYTVFNTSAPIHLLTHSPGTKLDAEWEDGDWGSRYLGSVNHSSKLTKAYKVANPQGAIELLYQATLKGTWGNAGLRLPVPGCYQHDGRRVYCTAVEWEFDFDSKEPTVHANYELAHTLPHAGNCGSIRRVPCKFGQWNEGGLMASVSHSTGWSVVGPEKSLVTDVIGQTGHKGGIYVKLNNGDPLELLLAPGEVPTLIGGQRLHNPELEKRFDLALQGEHVAVGEMVWFQNKVHVAGHLKVAGEFDVNVAESDTGPLPVVTPPTAESLKTGETGPTTAEKSAGDKPGATGAVKTTPKDEYVIYRVRRGDTLSSIAERELGNTYRWKELADLNKINEHPRRKGLYLIFVNEPLILPSKTKQSKAPPVKQTVDTAKQAQSVLAPKVPAVPGLGQTAPTPPGKSLLDKVKDIAIGMSHPGVTVDFPKAGAKTKVFEDVKRFDGFFYKYEISVSGSIILQQMGETACWIDYKAEAVECESQTKVFGTDTTVSMLSGFEIQAHSGDPSRAPDVKVILLGTQVANMLGGVMYAQSYKVSAKGLNSWSYEFDVSQSISRDNVDYVLEMSTELTVTLLPNVHLVPVLKKWVIPAAAVTAFLKVAWDLRLAAAVTMGLRSVAQWLKVLAARPAAVSPFPFVIIVTPELRQYIEQSDPYSI